MIYVSTVKRTHYALDLIVESHVYIIDWGNRHIIKKIKVPEAMGVKKSSRFSGGRGFAKIGNTIFFANYDSIFRLNSDLTFEYFFSSNLFCAIHEIYADNFGIWITSTHTDSVFYVTYEKKVEQAFFLSEMSFLTKNTNLSPPVKHRLIQRDADHRFETYVEPVNELCCVPNSIEKIGDKMYVILKLQKVIIQLSPFRIVADISYISEPHSLISLKNGKVVILGASDTIVYIFDSEQFNEYNTIDLKNEKINWPNKMTWQLVDGFAKEGWLRGACEIENGNILVGISPFTLVEIDVVNRIVVDSCNFDPDTTISTFDIKTI